MGDLSDIAVTIERQDPIESERFLPLVYDELRRLAAHRLAGETGVISLGATDLVHEAYLRLKPDQRNWDSPDHFFAAAADEMRRILSDRARRRVKHGGTRARVELPELNTAEHRDLDDLLALQTALDHCSRRVPSRPNW